MIRFNFNPAKSTQAAAYLLKKSRGSMGKYVLLKMLYLADREALKRWDVPITGDEPHSMQFGPVPSRIYDLTKGAIRHSKAWHSSITTRGSSTIVLKADPGRDELSDEEIELLDSIHKQFKGYSFSRMKEYCHALPEYDGSVGRGSRPIPIESLLRHLGKTPESIQDIGDSERAAMLLRDAMGA